jgi:hypothetical protein
VVFVGGYIVRTAFDGQENKSIDDQYGIYDEIKCFNIDHLPWYLVICEDEEYVHKLDGGHQSCHSHCNIEAVSDLIEKIK